MVTEIKEETVENTIDLFLKKFSEKIEQKGSNSFNSMVEIFGKLCEENYEVLRELHKKDKEKFCEELFDVAIVCIFGVASLRAIEEVENG